MIGSGVGSGVGVLGLIPEPPFVVQKIRLSGFVPNSSPTTIPPSSVLDFSFVQANSLVLEISVSFQDGTSFETQEGAEFIWVLSSDNPEQTEVLRKTLDTGIQISSDFGEPLVLEIILDADDTTNLDGYYKHELLILDEDGDQMSVVKDERLTPGKVFVRKRIVEV